VALDNLIADFGEDPGLAATILRTGYEYRRRANDARRAGKGMVLEPGLIRWTITEGPFRDLFVVIDTINNRILWGNRDDGIIGDVKRPINSEHDFFQRPIETLWNLRDGSEENLGKKEMNDKEVAGFRVLKDKEQEKGVFDITVWADVETGLPVEVEIISRESADKPENMRTVLKDFEFDVEMDPSLFAVPPTETDRSHETEKFTIYGPDGLEKEVLQVITEKDVHLSAPSGDPKR
jgi:hypothetical protein